MTRHKTLYRRDGIDRLYVSKKEKARGFTSIEVSGDASVRGIEDNIKKKQREIYHSDQKNRESNIKINRTTTTRKQKWEEKHL